LKRHPGEPPIKSEAGAGVQTSSRPKSGTISKTISRASPGALDFGFRQILCLKKEGKSQIFGYSSF